MWATRVPAQYGFLYCSVLPEPEGDRAQRPWWIRDTGIWGKGRQLLQEVMGESPLWMSNKTHPCLSPIPQWGEEEGSTGEGKKKCISLSLSSHRDLPDQREIAFLLGCGVKFSFKGSPCSRKYASQALTINQSCFNSQGQCKSIWPSH